MIRRETLYFATEGRENYEATLEAVRSRAAEGDIEALITFSATAEGARLAVTVLGGESMPPLKIVTYRSEAVSFEQSEDGVKEIPIGLPLDINSEPGFEAIEVVRAPLPFSEVVVLNYSDPKLAGIREALRLVSGGLGLVVQAVTMACDAGLINQGQRVVSFAADTAAVITASHGDTIFFPNVGMEIHEIICKPIALTISRSRRVTEDDE